ncbi:hypothetical protein BSKO_00271 [Bryopsis sp. KO-2023]|nr:hypothetical protein BSKO_00271 [Bryopsis sp. KO-2023]
MYDRSVKGYIYTCSRGPACKLQLPRDGLGPMHLFQPYICLQVLLVENQTFSLELRVNCTDGTRRRLLFSTCFAGVKTTALHCQIPLSGLNTNTWTNLAVHAADLVEQFFPGVGWRSTDVIVVGGALKLRRIFTLKHPPLDTTGGCKVYAGGVVAIPRSVDFPHGVAGETQVLDSVKVNTWLVDVRNDNQKDEALQSVRGRPSAGDTGGLSSRSRHGGPMHVAFGSRFPVLLPSTTRGSRHATRRSLPQRLDRCLSHRQHEEGQVAASLNCDSSDQEDEHRENISPNPPQTSNKSAEPKQTGARQSLLPDIKNRHRTGAVERERGRPEPGCDVLTIEHAEHERLPMIQVPNTGCDTASSPSSCWSSENGDADSNGCLVAKEKQGDLDRIVLRVAQSLEKQYLGENIGEVSKGQQVQNAQRGEENLQGKMSVQRSDSDYDSDESFIDMLKDEELGCCLDVQSNRLYRIDSC